MKIISVYTESLQFCQKLNDHALHSLKTKYLADAIICILQHLHAETKDNSQIEWQQEVFNTGLICLKWSDRLSPTLSLSLGSGPTQTGLFINILHE